MVDGVILVVHAGKSSKQVVRRSRQLLNEIGAKIFGVVLNNVNLSTQDNYYYYQSYYHRDNYRQSDEQRGAEDPVGPIGAERQVAGGVESAKEEDDTEKTEEDLSQRVLVKKCTAVERALRSEAPRPVNARSGSSYDQ